LGRKTGFGKARPAAFAEAQICAGPGGSDKALQAPFGFNSFFSLFLNQPATLAAVD
jgi:hypothetical protein